MSMMLRGLMGACAMTALAVPAVAETLTIATVNNGDMIRMQKMTKPFTDANPDIQLEWVTLEENVLRQRVTTDIATKGGQYDIVTVGNYEVPIWAKQGWLLALEDMGEDYDAADILPPYAPQIDGDRSAPRERRRLVGALRLMDEAPANHHLPAGERYVDLSVDEKCTACGVCARICPNEALLFEQGEDEFWLGFVAANCTNCDLCTRYCDPQALKFNGTPTVSRLTDRPILLRHDTLYRCQKCSAPYSGDENGGLCPVCAFRRDNPFGSRPPTPMQDKLKK